MIMPSFFMCIVHFLNFLNVKKVKKKLWKTENVCLGWNLIWTEGPSVLNHIVKISVLLPSWGKVLFINNSNIIIPLFGTDLHWVHWINHIVILNRRFSYNRHRLYFQTDEIFRVSYYFLYHFPPSWNNTNKVLTYDWLPNFGGLFREK